jgi:hypothetical protein
VPSAVRTRGCSAWSLCHLSQLNRLANGGETGNNDGLEVPERGLQVSPFMMFMLFMGMVYVVLTLQQRATRQDRIEPDAKGGGGGGAGDGAGGDAAGAGGPAAPGPGPAVD